MFDSEKVKENFKSPIYKILDEVKEVNNTKILKYLVNKFGKNNTLEISRKEVEKYSASGGTFMDVFSNEDSIYIKSFDTEEEGLILEKQLKEAIKKDYLKIFKRCFI